MMPEPTTHDLLPWHEEAWLQMQRALAAQRLPHALLLIGPYGVGKSSFAAFLARAILCEDRAEGQKPCGSCPSCTQFMAGTHTDVSYMAPEEDSSVIKVDQVRRFSEQLFLTSGRGYGKIGLIEPAHALNPNAANALLKTLEEPPTGSHIILMTEQPALLPATVRSRSQILRLASPAPEQAEQWLKANAPEAIAELPFVSYAPMAAMRRARSEIGKYRTQWLAGVTGLIQGRADPVSLVDQWGVDYAQGVIDWLFFWWSDVLKSHLGIADLHDRQSRKDILKAAEHTSRERLRLFGDDLLEARRLLSQTQASAELVLESTLIKLQAHAH